MTFVSKKNALKKDGTLKTGIKAVTGPDGRVRYVGPNLKKKNPAEEIKKEIIKKETIKKEKKLKTKETKTTKTEDDLNLVVVF